jgi:hypothetical protein
MIGYFQAEEAKLTGEKKLLKTECCSAGAFGTREPMTSTHVLRESTSHFQPTESFSTAS